VIVSDAGPLIILAQTDGCSTGVIVEWIFFSDLTLNEKHGGNASANLQRINPNNKQTNQPLTSHIKPLFFSKEKLLSDVMAKKITSK
jgi:hypothetical protein